MPKKRETVFLYILHPFSVEGGSAPVILLRQA